MNCPTNPEFEKEYNGNCQCLSEHCIGEDSQPFTNYKYDTKPRGIVLCTYHGTLIHKLRLLTLPQLEYIMKRRECKPLVKDLMKIIIPPSSNNKISVDKSIHNIRLTAMRVSDEYFVKNHREIFGCYNTNKTNQLPSTEAKASNTCTCDMTILMSRGCPSSSGGVCPAA